MNCIKCWVITKKPWHCKICADRCKQSEDTQDVVNKDTSKIIRNKFWIWNIWNNSIQCKTCKTTIRSKNKHHHVSCKCWWCSLDWGSVYVRVMWTNYKLLTESFDDNLKYNVFKEQSLY